MRAPVDARTIAGWVAVLSGALLVIAFVVSAIAGPTAPYDPATGRWPMGPGMMGPGMMGGDHRGMMGFANAGPAATAIPGAAEVRVEASNFAFSPSEIRLPKSAEVNLTLVNPAATGVVHDLTVPSLGVHVVANAGETRTVGLRGLAAGRYDAYCAVPGHAQLGMRATVIVE